MLVGLVGGFGWLSMWVMVGVCLTFLFGYDLTVMVVWLVFAFAYCDCDFLLVGVVWCFGDFWLRWVDLVFNFGGWFCVGVGLFSYHFLILRLD